MDLLWSTEIAPCEIDSLSTREQNRANKKKLSLEVVLVPDVFSRVFHCLYAPASIFISIMIISLDLE